MFLNKKKITETRTRSTATEDRILKPQSIYQNYRLDQCVLRDEYHYSNPSKANYPLCSSGLESCYALNNEAALMWLPYYAIKLVASSFIHLIVFERDRVFVK